MSKLSLFLKKHPMFETLFSLKGNPRICVYTEPLFAIPYYLFVPYAALYMSGLGVTDGQIGFLLSVGMVFQVFSSFISGAITDKWGRRKITFIFDTVSWSLPCLIWMFAQNFWWFLAATLVNSLLQITANSWNCLLVEDTQQSKLVNVYNWVMVAGLCAVFFAPLAGVLVFHIGITSALRLVYLLAFIMMTAKFLILFIWGKETRQGIRRMEETREVPAFRLIAQNAQMLKKIFKTPSILFVLALMALINITTVITNNFFGLYITSNLGIPEQFVAIFPIARAAVMLIFVFLLQPILARVPFRQPMMIGTLLYICAQIMLVVCSQGSYPILIIYLFMDAFGYALLIPRKDSVLVMLTDPKERARIMGLLYSLMLLLSAPFSWIAGMLAQTVSRAVPFMLNMILYVICAVMIVLSKSLQQKITKQE